MGKAYLVREALPIERYFDVTFETFKQFFMCIDVYITHFIDVLRPKRLSCLDRTQFDQTIRTASTRKRTPRLHSNSPSASQEIELENIDAMIHFFRLTPLQTSTQPQAEGQGHALSALRQALSGWWQFAGVSLSR
jgi:hypothetical protein